MNNKCSLCGAAMDANITCQRIFDKFLALKFSNPAYGKVHILTDNYFMIQHQLYSDPALLWMQQALRDVLENGVVPSDIRLQMTSEVDQSKRQ